MALDRESIPRGAYKIVAFVNVNVIPMDRERVLERQTVIIKGGRISELNTDSEVVVPSDALVIDGEGKFLIPGLSDMHIHLNGSENDLLLYSPTE